MRGDISEDDDLLQQCNAENATQSPFHVSHKDRTSSNLCKMQKTLSILIFGPLDLWVRYVRSEISIILVLHKEENLIFKRAIPHLKN